MRTSNVDMIQQKTLAYPVTPAHDHLGHRNKAGEEGGTDSLVPKSDLPRVFFRLCTACDLLALYTSSKGKLA